jgi:hypothetical protein
MFVTYHNGAAKSVVVPQGRPRDNSRREAMYRAGTDTATPRCMNTKCVTGASPASGRLPNVLLLDT